MVLILSLLISWVLSLLILSTLNQIRTERQLAHTVYAQDTLSYGAEKKINAIIAAMLRKAHPACMVEAQDPNDAPALLLKNNAVYCQETADEISFSYNIEDLEIWPCIITPQKRPSHFYRVNMLARRSPNAILLQVVFTVGAKARLCKNGDVVVRREGIQSWRQVFFE